MGDFEAVVVLDQRHPMHSVMSSFREISELENSCAVRCCAYTERKKSECKHVTNLWDDGRVVLGPVEASTTSFLPEAVKGLFFVCFCGALNAEDPRREERWAADQSMCEEMTKMDVTIRAYISIPFREEEPLGEWYNLVLFDDLAFIDTFEKSELHKFAKKSLSPDSFTHVSVRRGVVQNSDDLSGAIHLHVTRSVMITYGADGGMERKVFNENDCSD